MQRTACRRPPTSNSRQATSIPGMHPRPPSFWPWPTRGCRPRETPQPPTTSRNPPCGLPFHSLPAPRRSRCGAREFSVLDDVRAPRQRVIPHQALDRWGMGAQDQEPADQVGNRGSPDERPSAGRTTRSGTRSSTASTASGSAGRSALAAPHRTAHGSSCRQRRWAVGGDGPSALLRVDKGQGVGRTPPPGPRPGPHQRAFTLLPGRPPVHAEWWFSRRRADGRPTRSFRAAGR